jgi:hypothetical protein
MRPAGIRTEPYHGELRAMTRFLVAGLNGMSTMEPHLVDRLRPLCLREWKIWMYLAVRELSAWEKLAEQESARHGLAAVMRRETEIAEKTRRSAAMYLLLQAQGLVADLAWGITALAHWVL